MSNTEDRYREQDARRMGYVVGSYGEPKHLNPYTADDDAYAAWIVGWESGHAASERMKTRKVRAI